MLRRACDFDFDFLNDLAPIDVEERLHAQIRDGRLFIIEVDGKPVGFIKSYALWEFLPFIEVIVVRKDLRGRGIGKAAVRAWEQEMAKRSFTRTIISTQATGTAQGFWRRIGYRDCGSLDLPGRPAELFMYYDTPAGENSET